MDIFSIRMDTKDLDTFSQILREKRSAVVRDLVAEGKRAKALALYAEGRVSLGLGARLAGVTLSEFIDMLKQHNVTLSLEKDDVMSSLEDARNVW